MREYPLVPLKSTVIFPRNRVNLTIGRDKSVRAVEEAYKTEKQFIAAAQRDADLDDPAPDDIFDTGTLVDILQYQPQQDGTIQITVEGARRVRVKQWVEREPYLRVAATRPAEPAPAGAQADALVRFAVNLFERYAQLNRRFSADDIAAATAHQAPGRLADTLAAHVLSDYKGQQALLEVLDPLARLEKLTVALGNEIEILELEAKIRQRVRQQVDKNQKEYYLKEQLR
ncbi:MAG TPA: LON peptidase substrate-binding domain-containing protein, partial [Ktedonobacterales bacterium]